MCCIYFSANLLNCSVSGKLEQYFKTGYSVENRKEVKTLCKCL